MPNIFEDELDNVRQFNEQLEAEVNDVITSNQRIVRNKPEKAPINWTKGLPTGRVELASVTAVIFILMWTFGWQLAPFNKVNHLTVSGNEIAESEMVAYSSGIRSLDTIKNLMANREQIEKNIIKSNPIVSGVVFDRVNWKQMDIKVSEYHIVAIVEIEGELYPLLENGEILVESNKYLQENMDRFNLPRILNVEQKGKLVTVATALRRVEPDVLALIDTIELSKDLNRPNHLSMKMKDGMYVKAVASTVAEKINKYPAMKKIIGDQMGTVNLEVGAYFTPEAEGNNNIKLDTNLDN